VRVVTGGKGGKGNVNFKSGDNRVPREFTRGDPGEERMLELELKYGHHMLIKQQGGKMCHALIRVSLAGQLLTSA
jgi:hypothetical protein